MAPRRARSGSATRAVPGANSTGTRVAVAVDRYCDGGGGAPGAQLTNATSRTSVRCLFHIGQFATKPAATRGVTTAADGAWSVGSGNAAGLVTG